MSNRAISLEVDHDQNSPVLTERQEAFCQAYVLSGNGRQAALDAGYAESTAKNAYVNILGSDGVRDRIRELRRQLRDEVCERLAASAVKAAAYLDDVLTDEDAPHTVRVRAAAEVLDRTGYERNVEPRGLGVRSLFLIYAMSENYSGRAQPTPYALAAAPLHTEFKSKDLTPLLLRASPHSRACPACAGAGCRRLQRRRRRRCRLPLPRRSRSSAPAGSRPAA